MQFHGLPSLEVCKQRQTDFQESCGRCYYPCVSWRLHLTTLEVLFHSAISKPWPQVGSNAVLHIPALGARPRCLVPHWR